MLTGMHRTGPTMSIWRRRDQAGQGARGVGSLFSYSLKGNHGAASFHKPFFPALALFCAASRSAFRILGVRLFEAFVVEV